MEFFPNWLESQSSFVYAPVTFTENTKKFDKNYGMITQLKIQDGISYQVQSKETLLHIMSYIWGLFFIHFHYRRDAKHIFECFLEVGQPEDYSQNPYIIQSYPLNYKDREADKLQSVPAFTFPCQIEMWVIFFWHIFVFTNVLHKTAGNN